MYLLFVSPALMLLLNGALASLELQPCHTSAWSSDQTYLGKLIEGGHPCIVHMRGGTCTSYSDIWIHPSH